MRFEPKRILSTKEFILSICGAGEDFWESFGLQGDQTSQSQRKSALNILWKDWCWSWSSNTLATCCKERLTGKDPDAGKDWRPKVKWVAEDKMVRQQCWLTGHEFEQTSGDSGGQRSLVSSSPWVSELDRLSDWTTTIDYCRGPAPADPGYSKERRLGDLFKC